MSITGNAGSASKLKGSLSAKQNISGNANKLSVIHGQTPYIKDGNWWIGEVDTGERAIGVDGKDGIDGKDGYTPIKGVDYFDGQDGKDGADGYTPQKGVDYFDGKDGKDGQNGTNGKDGYTPVKGVDYFDGKDGANGKDGTNGKDGYTPVKGVDYFDGEDGVSPTVAVSDISGGHRITITDKDGSKTVDVMDGGKGDTGKTAYQYAKDGGYTGTEAQFATKLASEYPSKTSELTNDSGFITKAVADLANYYIKSESYNKTEVNTLISKIPKFNIKVISALPSEGISPTTVYLKVSNDGNEQSNIYSEFIFVIEEGTPDDGTGNYYESDGMWEKLGEQKLDLSGYATETWVKGYAQPIGDYLLESDLQNAINSALATAKASGEFDGADGKDGKRGFSILRVTTAPSAYTTATGGFTPAYRIALSTVKSQASVDEVRVGDTILRNYYTYKVGYVDTSYAYLTTYASIRGSAGADGATAEQVIAAMSKETWTFTLADGSTVTKVVPLI